MQETIPETDNIQGIRVSFKEHTLCDGSTSSKPKPGYFTELS